LKIEKNGEEIAQGSPNVSIKGKDGHHYKVVIPDYIEKPISHIEPIRIWLHTKELPKSVIISSEEHYEDSVWIELFPKDFTDEILKVTDSPLNGLSKDAYRWRFFQERDRTYRLILFDFIKVHGTVKFELHLKSEHIVPLCITFEDFSELHR
jgi:hypothetical protein